jgi:ribosomal protein S18 acetylase RimI-like enzyme
MRGRRAAGTLSEFRPRSEVPPPCLELCGTVRAVSPVVAAAPRMPSAISDTGEMTEIREARIDDVPDIVRIDPLGSLGATAIESLVRTAASLVAVSGSDITGFLARRERHFYGRDFVELLFVGPAHRRKGVGGSLMRRTLADAATSRVFTSTNQSNEAMQALLTSGDWVLSGILVGLDEVDPEHVFFHDVPCAAEASKQR